MNEHYLLSIITFVRKITYFVLWTFFVKCKIFLPIFSEHNVFIIFSVHVFFINVYIFYYPHRFSLKRDHYLVLWMLFIKSRNPNIGNIFKTIFIQLRNFSQWTILWESTLSAFQNRFCLMKNIFVLWTLFIKCRNPNIGEISEHYS